MSVVNSIIKPVDQSSGVSYIKNKVKESKGNSLRGPEHIQQDPQGPKESQHFHFQ